MSKPRTPKDYAETVERLLEEARSKDIAFAEREREESAREGVSRRALLQMGALAGAGAAVAGSLAGVPARGQEPADGLATESDDSAKAGDPGPSQFNDLTIAQLQALMAKGHLNSQVLTTYYLQRIHDVDRRGPKVNSILQTNPDALAIAKALDAERKSKGPRGPLHGIPVILKDNYDTADKMPTTAGSLALLGPPPSQDSTCVARLRAAGAVILGKANLSEWANFRSFSGSSGWSGRGGQTSMPYVLDRNPSGSSSGSAVAVSANFTSVALGTETDGSIVSPSNNSGIVGIHPTLGLTSRAGVIPISHNQDVTGPHGRTVADAAAVLSALVGVDPRDPATAGSAGKFSTDYTQFLDKGGLKGARIGVARQVYTGYSPKTDAIYEEAIAAMRSAGAVIIDPADIPTAQLLNSDPSETILLVYDFKRDLNAYLASRHGLAVHTLADLIAFNEAAAAIELKFFGQEIFLLAQSDPFTKSQYDTAVATAKAAGGVQGIDAVFAQFHLDALIAPTGAPAWSTDLIDGDHFLGASSTPAAVAGYPNITVNAGYSFGLPVGVSFMGPAYSEAKLIKIAYAFEQTIHLRQQPKFVPSIGDFRGSGNKSSEAEAAQVARIASQVQDAIGGGSTSGLPFRFRNI
jgi:amidase